MSIIIVLLLYNMTTAISIGKLKARYTGTREPVQQCRVYLRARLMNLYNIVSLFSLRT